MRAAALVLLTCLLAAAAPAQRQKVIIDCDLGGDIDDAYALALLVASPELEVLGIVTGHGRCEAFLQRFLERPLIQNLGRP